MLLKQAVDKEGMKGLDVCLLGPLTESIVIMDHYRT